MKFILDENISIKVDSLFPALGHTISRLPFGTKDHEIFAAAKKEKAAIVSHDKDFMNMAVSEIEGIILLKIHPPRSREIRESLQKFFTRVSAEDWKGKLVLLEKDGFHIRF